jgi:pimeloyl-ACP methyl ester carboxylesterase
MRTIALALSLTLAPSLAACSPTRMAYSLSDARFASAGYHERTVRLDNGLVHYWVGGEGPPLLLLHGFGGNAAIQWDHQAAALARDHTVIMPDLLFFGDSTTRRANRSVEFQADTVIQLMDHLGVDEPVDAMGVSYGGFVTWGLAVKYAARVKRIILVDSPGTAYTAEDLTMACAYFGVESPHELLLPQEPEDIARLLRVVIDPAPWMPKWIARDILRDFERTDQRAQSELLDELVDQLDASWDNVPVPQQPALLVWGENDHLFTVAVAERLQALLGDDTTLSLIEGGAHGPNRFQSRAFNRTVLAFLAEEQPEPDGTR